MDEQDYASQQPAPRYPAGKRELRFGAALLLCSVFLWNSILYGGFNLGFAIGSLTVIGCSVWYLLANGCRFDRYSGSLLGLGGVLAAGFARSSDSFVKFVMLLFLLFAVNESFCLAAGQNRRSPGGVGSILDAPRAFFVLGVGGMGASARGLNDARKSAESAGKKGGAAVLGMVIALPVAAILVALLIRADAAFAGLMGLLPQIAWSELLASLVMGILAGWILYARALGLRRSGKAAPRESRFRGMSPVTIHIALSAVCLIYGAYLASQLAYLGGGFSGILPEGYTLAQYARRGFFEMAWLSAINLGLIGLAVGLVDRKAPTPGLTRALCLILCAVTLFLIATASAKMLLYIGQYGLTRLRVLTQVIMIWLALIAVLASVRLLKPRFPYMKAAVLSALLLGAMVFWADVDAQVAQYNVRAYLEGRLETVDLSHLEDLGYGAVPYIGELAGSGDPETAGRAADILEWKSASAQTGDFRDWNYSKAAAEEIRKQYPAEREQAEVLPGPDGA